MSGSLADLTLPSASAGSAPEAETAIAARADKQAEPRRALTAVRGLAAWWVVVFHFRTALPEGTPGFVKSIAERGYLAVDLFFVLSGYVIALNYAHWFAGEPFRPGRYAKFLALRLSRIYPLHLFMLVIFLTVPVATALLSSQGGVGQRWDYYALSFPLMQGWGIVGGSDWNVPAWSISTEWLAYLLFPLLVTILVTLALTRLRTALCGAALLALLAWATRALSPEGLWSERQVYLVLRCVLEFSLGITVLLFDRGRMRTRRESIIALLLCVPLLIPFASGWTQDWAVMPLLFWCLVYGLADERGWAAGLLRGRTLQWLGLVSYSTYLSHYFLKVWTKLVLVRPGIPQGVVFPLYLLEVLVASALLYPLVEHTAQVWCRRRLKAWERRDTALKSEPSVAVLP